MVKQHERKQSQGGPISLAMERSYKFNNSKTFIESTPLYREKCAFPVSDSFPPVPGEGEMVSLAKPRLWINKMWPCPWVLGDSSCKYCGPDTRCNKTFEDCSAKHNVMNFGGYSLHPFAWDCRLSDPIKDLQDAQDHIRRQTNFEDVQFLQPSEEDTTMKLLSKVETQTTTFVNGVNVDDLNNEQLMQAVINTEKEIDRLDEMKTKSKVIDAMKERYKKNIDKIVEIMDGRPAEDASE